jgi:hypothetical protein
LSEDIKYSVTPITEIPKREFVKQSKYDVIIDNFIKQVEDDDITIGEVEVEGLKAKDKASYLRMQLQKRVDARELNTVYDTRTVNNKVYIFVKSAMPDSPS